MNRTCVAVEETADVVMTNGEVSSTRTQAKLSYHALDQGAQLCTVQPVSNLVPFRDVPSVK